VEEGDCTSARWGQSIKQRIEKASRMSREMGGGGGLGGINRGKATGDVQYLRGVKSTAIKHCGGLRKTTLYNVGDSAGPIFKCTFVNKRMTLKKNHGERLGEWGKPPKKTCKKTR